MSIFRIICALIGPFRECALSGLHCAGFMEVLPEGCWKPLGRYSSTEEVAVRGNPLTFFGGGISFDGSRALLEIPTSAALLFGDRRNFAAAEVRGLVSQVIMIP